MQREKIQVYKLDGEPLTSKDFYQLYVTDGMSVATIAYVLDADPIAVYDNTSAIYTRVEDRYMYAEWKVLDEQLAFDIDHELWEQAERMLGRTKPVVEHYFINGKQKTDVHAIKGYYRDVETKYYELINSKKNKKYNKELDMQFRVVDLSAMRLHRGLDMMQFSQKSEIPYKYIVYYEKTKGIVVPNSVGNTYMRILDISKKELKNIRECLSGDRLSMHEEEGRSIPEPVRQYVFKRDGGKCTRCDRTTFLHFHHKRRFSEGGKHEARNIVLLCVGCHAGEHYGEKAFAMLKAKAEKLGVAVNVG